LGQKSAGAAAFGRFTSASLRSAPVSIPQKKKKSRVCNEGMALFEELHREVSRATFVAQLATTLYAAITVHLAFSDTIKCEIFLVTLPRLQAYPLW
jgi:flagellar motor switch protein FliM